MYSYSSNGKFIESESPIEVLRETNYSPCIYLDEHDIWWQLVGSFAIADAARIELHKNSHLAPIEVSEVLLSFLINGEMNFAVSKEIDKLDLDNRFNMMVYHTYKSVVNGSPEYTMIVFDQLSDKSLDLHLRAIKLFEEKRHYSMPLEDVFEYYKSLEGNPIQGYWARVAIDNHRYGYLLDKYGIPTKLILE